MILNPDKSEFNFSCGDQKFLPYPRLAANAYKKGFRKLENVVKPCMREMNFVEERGPIKCAK